MKIIVAISGASGAELGLKLIYALPETIEKHLIVTDNAKIVLKKSIK
jgi:4-hydroxy-3-polyprenylbenzoate decarboxylase